MAFPGKPVNADQAPSRFLPLFAVPDRPGVYILGCFARYVTIYAQQVRALNLIHCLAVSGVLSSRTRLAVIGGGIAGVTAAAAAIRFGISDVVVFEQDKEDILSLQRTSEQRYVHPHIYDWPQPDAANDAAGLPLLTWHAGRAADVRNEIKGQWDRILLESGLAGKTWNRPRATRIDKGERGAIVTSASGSEAFDVAILAVGFGSDKVPGADADGYWADSRINSNEVNSEAGDWLVSGTGDGALTDLMRLCIRGFRHEQVLGEVDEAVSKQVGADLLAAEHGGAGPDQMMRIYMEAASKVGGYLDGKELLRERTIPGKVWLNSKKRDIFQPRASVLNRLLTAYLLSRERFYLVKSPRKIVVDHKWSSGPSVNLVLNGDQSEFLVRHIILRHGPDKQTTLAARFPEIHKDFAEVISAWTSVRQHEDWTREPLYLAHNYEPDRLPPLRVDFGGRSGCITIGKENDPEAGSFRDLARDSLERFQTFSTKPVDLDVQHFDAGEVFGSLLAYERAVRALCYSPFAVFDLTGHNPGVMILLGIRAAVRRGVTLSVTRTMPDRPPFNLTGTNPILLNDSSVAPISTAMLAGAEALRDQSAAYLDLPVFDALRRVSTQSGTISFREKILLLGWFNEPYRKLVKNKIDQEFVVRQIKTDIVTTLDSSSPQLLEQRLYALIRFAELCIADWTGWRPNVFFEFGVRLAANGIDPISILCEPSPVPSETAATVTADFARILTAFFGATPFSPQKVDALRLRLRHFIEHREVHRPDAMPVPKLPAGRTYAVVMNTIDPAAEPGGLPIDRHLEEHAKSLVRAFVAEGGDIVPLLYADVLGEQAKAGALESLLALWFYWEGRYDMVKRRRQGGLTRDEEAVWKRMQELWNKIDFLFGEVRSHPLKPVRKKLEAAMRADSKPEK